jgi:hypothetical protein
MNKTEKSQKKEEMDYLKKYSQNDIKVVQNLIERCLRLYMNKNETIFALHIYQNIEPEFITFGKLII